MSAPWSLPAAVAVVLLHLWSARRRAEGRSAVRRLRGDPQERRDRNRWLPSLLLGGATLVAAWDAGLPELRPGSAELLPDRRQVVLLLDVSRSMAVREGATTRGAQARIVARRLSTEVPGAAVGLVAFTSTAHLLVPPTLDRRTLDLHLEALRPGTAVARGSRGVPVLRQARGLLEEVEDGKEGRVTKTVFVLISDGELHDHGEELREHVRRIRRAGAVLSTIVVGRPEGGTVPGVSWGEGEAVSRARPEVMRDLARAGGGVAGDVRDPPLRILPSVGVDGGDPGREDVADGEGIEAGLALVLLLTGWGMERRERKGSTAVGT